MEHSNMAKIFKALSNEQRLKLFLLIYDYWRKNQKSGNITQKGNQTFSSEGIEKAFTRACEKLNLARSTVSHHFKELQNAGLIDCQRKGQMYTCKVNMNAIHAVRQFLK